jgi:hypothetical protein
MSFNQKSKVKVTLHIKKEKKVFLSDLSDYQ